MTFYSVCHVEVVGQFWMLAGYGRDTFHSWQDTQFLAVCADCQVLLLHVS